MPLFQQSVQKKFIKDLDKATIEAAYQKLVAHFGNADVQDNIRKAKEEQYQEGFLDALFVDVLGYTLNPQPNFNLITEQKNEKNSKKADGAILKNDKPIAVIELKSVKTTDLQSIEIQAFNYKNNQTECVYVVTSNFQKIRFYIENAVDFEEFDLFDLSKERFELLYLCLHVNHVLSDLPLRIKQASLEREENITKKLYADYSLFKQTLFKDISTQNKGLDSLTLFKKTQKLLDRFLFIFFAEDKGLLPPNSVSEILNQWDKLKELDAYQPLYNRFKLYFGYLNYGHVGKHHTIFAYNGGLFAPDAVLDALIITDNILYNHCRVLSHYDFDTEVDTNILGHIFEHSLNEVDEIAANTEGSSFDKTKTKRKKDGIFYTPRYITKYIVESTVGQLCQQKKQALGLDNEALIKADTKKDRKLYQSKIAEYRQWLLQLTILDPACGSGAFLNQALEFLIQEHRLVDTMTAMLFGDSLMMTDNVTEILENNIFGVDINEESVDIARLALWLRTAKIGRKLNDLSRNIKCGNSLISDPSVAGDLAFDWQAAFPQVFQKGGFDVVIGNPPYVRQELLPILEKEWLIKNYQVGNGTADLYTYFYEKSLILLKENGSLGFITPNKFIKAGYGKKLRHYLSNLQIRGIVDFGELPVFSDAATFPCILLIDKQLTKGNTRFTKLKTLIFSSVEQVVTDLGCDLEPNIFKVEQWQLANNDKGIILDKIKDKGIILKDYLKGTINYGIKTGFNEAFIIDKTTKNRLISENSNSAELIKPFFVGDDIRFYRTNLEDKYIILTKIGVEIDHYPAILKHLQSHKEKLEKRYDKGKFYWELRACDYYNDFEKNKIIYPVIAKEPRFTIDTSGAFSNDKTFIIATEDYFLLTVLNSKLIWFYLKSICSVLGDEDNGGRLELRSIYLKQLPIAMPSEIVEKELSEKGKLMLQMQVDFQKQTTRFLKLLQSTFPTLTVTKKLDTWYALSFGDFRQELSKQKLAIPIKELMDYQELFETHAAALKTLQHQIAATERAIDALVYALYDLTDEEIQLIDNQ